MVDQNAREGISRRHVVGGAGAGVVVAGASLPSAAAATEGEELILVRKPALNSAGRVVAPCVRSRMFVRRKGEMGYGRAICDFIETPSVGGRAFTSDIPTGENLTRTRFSSVRGYLGMGDDSWELVISDRAHAGADPRNERVAQLSASLPINTDNDAEREYYTRAVEPKRAVKQLKKIVGRFGENAKIKVI